MADLAEYNPLQWPPDIKLAEIHYNCSKPGIDNTQGAKCPCCDRYEKLQNTKWPRREIAKDFKNYGGGIPGYFYLIMYFVSFLLLLTLIKVIYHIYMLQKICPHLEHDPKIRCTGILGIFKFCAADILYYQSIALGYQAQAKALQILNLATYLILIAATIGIKIFLQYLNKDRISLDEKLFSKFSLIIKNVPLYYQLEDLKEELKAISPKTQINQMFYLHKYCKYQQLYREIFDLYFKINHLEQQARSDDREKKLEGLRLQYHKYIQLYDQVTNSNEIKSNSKKILVVFNTIEEKEIIHSRLRMNGLVKFVHYFFRLFNCKTEPIGYYSERLTEPQEVIWKNIGESSTKKQKVRIQTTILGVGFMILTFAILYFPMIKIDEQKTNRPGLGTALGTLISIIIIILSIIYRRIILGLMPTRRPSSKLAEAFFIILTTIVFHFFFYVVTPAAFYIFAKSIPPNYKLKEFFSAVFLFSLMVLLVAILDLKYRLFNKRKERLLGQVSESNNYCQQRLHEELTPPSFPIEFKLMVIFNIWTFNSFYIFEIPYLIFLFMIILIILYWIDKRNLYKHYKMQHYISIELEVKVQKFYIIFFLICVSGGYYSTSVFLWQKITIAVTFILALIINFTLNFSYKKHKDNILNHNIDLKSAIQESKQSFVMISHINLMQQELKNSFLVPPVIDEFSSISLATELMSYGYLQTYKLFKMQFKNKDFNQMLEDKYLSIRKSKTMLDVRKIKESQLPRFDGNNQLSQALIEERQELEQDLPVIKIIDPKKQVEEEEIKVRWGEEGKVQDVKYGQNESSHIQLISGPNMPSEINQQIAQSKQIQSSEQIIPPNNTLSVPLIPDQNNNSSKQSSDSHPQ